MRRLLTAVATAFLACSAMWSDTLSPAAARVAAAEKRVASTPKSWEAYNDLAFALCRLARDTGDISLYEKADAALHRSLELAPGNYEAQKLTVTTLLGKHDLEGARKLAVELNHKVPDDIGGWGLLVDVYIALGKYDEAERAAQWILDLRAGSTLGFVKAAALRDIFGDPEGAAEFYEEALKRTARSDVDEQAWLLTQDAHEVFAMGKPERAQELLKRALTLFPDSRLALAGMAAIQSAPARASR
ncbi:MAG: tetratricopeptide repeat protein [Acidobacteriaceae bacterium]|nr:tetratricopeptide repeat protein [Acidobacteriaceae bacterium]